MNNSIVKLYVDPITASIDKYIWVFWSILWISLALGLGQDELIYKTGGIIEIPEIALIITILVLWVSIILQALRQYYYNDIITSHLAKLGNWFLLGSSTIFTFRLTWISVLQGYPVHISPIIILGTFLLGVGLSFTALSHMKKHVKQS